MHQHTETLDQYQSITLCSRIYKVVELVRMTKCIGKHPCINNCAMARFSSMSLIATVLVLANFVLISSAVKTSDLGKLEKKSVLFNEANIVTPEQQIFMKRFIGQNRSNRFIGDLIIGEDHPDQTLYSESLSLTNPGDQDASGTLQFTVPSGIINLVAVLNAPDSMVVICDTPDTLGSSTSTVNVRVLANSTSSLLVIVGAH